MSTEALFIEIGSHQVQKHGEDCFGDTVFSKKIPEERRVISVLSDGLGSGVKANILSSMTTRMAMKFVESDLDLLRSSEIMMQALPICQVRKISYSTFSIVDSQLDGKTRVFEMDNPSFLYFRGLEYIPLKSRQLSSPDWKDRTINISQFMTSEEDRVIIMSDGISQAGIGNRAYPLGWQRQGVIEFVSKTLKKNPNISAQDLSKIIVLEALAKEPEAQAGDDISCSVIYFRKPRKLLVVTGPPFDEDKDEELGDLVTFYDGKIAICGGTTSNIIEREINSKCVLDKTSFDTNIPLASKMEGVDIVTEGILTLTDVYRQLKEGIDTDKDNGATRLADMFLSSDAIDFVVGTKINVAHQDPNLPVELEIRRNIVRRIVKILQTKFLKEITVRYI